MIAETVSCKNQTGYLQAQAAVMQKHFKNKPDNIVKTYSTAGGFKQEVK